MDKLLVSYWMTKIKAANPEPTFYVNKNGYLYQDEFYIIGFNHYSTKQIYAIGEIIK